MKTLLNIILILPVAMAMMCLAGCLGSPSERVVTASRLVGERPDSAYAILRDVDYNDLDTDTLKARYILTRAIANVRVGRSLITDTLLGDAADCFIAAGDTAGWVLASQLLSGYDFIKGDAGQAIGRLEEMLPRIKSPALLWDTYLHLLELSINNGYYAEAFRYADWLSGHTDVAEQKLKFAAAKSASLYMRGNHSAALAVLDSVIATGTARNAQPEVAREFFMEYAEILDGAGHSGKAISVVDSLVSAGADISKVEQLLCRARYYANSGNSAKARALIDSINLDATQSVFEIYSSIAMLKAALQYRETGRFPSELMHEVSKKMHRNYRLAQFDRQTAMESVMELNDDNYELKLQRQRLWLLVAVISLVLMVCGVAVYITLSRRRQRMVEAEERAETLERMLKDMESAEGDADRLKAALLRQLGIFKTFAGTPTPQSREALKKISALGNGETEALVDWPEFYSMINSLYDGFHARLVSRYPDTFNDKEQQIIVLLKAGFSTKEIGVLTEQSSATIYTRKSVIRKKLGTPENGDIVSCLEG